MIEPFTNPSQPPVRQVAFSPSIPIPREVFRTSFWMRSYAAKSMKRTMVLSNRSIFTRLGSEANKPEKVDCEPTTRRYVDQQGRTRYAGTSRLKESQTLVVNKYCPVWLFSGSLEPQGIQKNIYWTRNFRWPKVLGHCGFICGNLRVYTGRFARALLTLYPEVAASPLVWPEEDFWLIMSTPD